MKLFRACCGVLALLAALRASPLFAQGCSPHWETPYQRFDASGEVRAQIIFDDGRGPTLYIAGVFFNAGGVGARSVARWSGHDWEPLGNGLNGTVYTLTAFDDGTGPALYAGGDFQDSAGRPINRVAKWTGDTWVQVGDGLNLTVRALAAFDNGAGPALYAAGLFGSSGSGAAVAGIARLTGTQWAPVGGGLHTLINGAVIDGNGYALATFDEDGPGPAQATLVVTGDFDRVGLPLTLVTKGIAAWTGKTWQPFGEGLFDDYDGTGWGLCLHVTLEPAGPALYVGGYFDSAGSASSRNIARWQNHAWSPLGLGFNASVSALTSFDSGNGPTIYAGGDFTRFADDPDTYVGHVAQWDGEAWRPLGAGIGHPGGVDHVRTFAEFDMGSGRSLMVGGYFIFVDAFPASYLCSWDGREWHRLGNGFRYGPLYLTPILEENRSVIYARFENSDYLGTDPIGPFARFDGELWTTVDASPLTDLASLGSANAGEGEQLYARSRTQNGRLELFRLAGTTWELMPTSEGVVGLPLALPTNGGRALYAALSDDDAFAVRLARWDGAQWTPLPNSTLTSQVTNAIIFDLVVFDDHSGTGPAVFACGYFLFVNGVHAPSIAKWLGDRWVPLGTGLRIPFGAVVYAYDMEVYDDGQGEGPALYVAGRFEIAGGVPARGIARWNGTSWSSVGGSLNSGAEGYAMSHFDDGSGDSLLLAGSFSSIGDAQVRQFAKWNGRSWTQIVGRLGPSSDSSFRDFARLDTHGMPSLWASGVGSIDGRSVSGIAQWVGCPNPCPTDWDHSGSLDSADFFSYLGSFFAGGGDFNGDGQVSTQDLFDFLRAYFIGCP